MQGLLNHFIISQPLDWNKKVAIRILCYNIQTEAPFPEGSLQC